jgi:hypothetical protein
VIDLGNKERIFLKSLPSELGHALKIVEKNELAGVEVRIAENSDIDALRTSLDQLKEQREYYLMITATDPNAAYKIAKEMITKGVDPSKLILNIPEPGPARGLKDELKCLIALTVTHPFPNVEALSGHGIDAIVMPFTLIKPRVVKEAHAKDLTVIAATVDDVSAAVKVISAGADALISEKPDILRQARKFGFA